MTVAGNDRKGPSEFGRAFLIQDQTTRSTIICLMCEIALAGFSPLGHVFAQFMIVWQR